MKKIISLIILFAIICLSISSCAIGKEMILSEMEYAYRNEDYSYYDWRRLASDEEITLDGKMDEEIWSKQKELYFGDDQITMHVTTYFGEKALYVGVYVEDTEIYSNPLRDDWRNTSIELHIASANATSRLKAIQLRVEADGRMGSLIGVDGSSGVDPAVAAYGWDFQFVPFYAKVFVDGELNTSSCKGVGYEVMVPWSALHMDEAGDCSILPAYNHTSGYEMIEGVDRKHIQASGNMNDPTSYLPFGKVGYTGNNEEPNDILGTSASGRLPTTGWDFSQKNEGIVKTTKSGQQFTFFKQAELSDRYTIQTTISNAVSLAGEGKVGIVCGMNSKCWLVAFITLKSNGTQSIDIVEMDDYGWYYGNSVTVDANDIKTEEGARLKVVREGNSVTIYYNNEVVMELTRDFLNDAGVPGFFTIDCSAEYSNYFYEKD